MLNLNHLKRNPRVPANFNFAEFNITLSCVGLGYIKGESLNLCASQNQIMLEDPHYIISEPAFIQAILDFLGKRDIDVAHYSLEIYDHPDNIEYHAYVLTIHSIYA